MKNASAKNMVAVLSALVMALALSVGAFVGTAHAYEDYSYGNDGYLGGSLAETGWYDIGSEYVPETGWYDVGSEYTPETGWYDIGSEYTPETGWYDVGSEYTPDYSYSGSSYGSSATYGSAYSYIPAVARPYVPSYVYSPSYTTSRSHQPTYSVATTPTNNTNVNTNTNNDTSVNTNTNIASTGAITNTFAPVINVNSGAQHRPVDYQFPRPVCTMYASSNYGPTNLTWTSQNATTAFISPNIGNVAVNGAVTVYPQGYTTYTLTVTGPGGSATCQAVSNYAPSYTVTPPPPAYTAPAPYVSLSQIPYTGFDYGPFGNAMYWGALLSFAAAAGYLLVYGMPKLALVGAFMGGNKNNPYNTSEVAEVFKPSIVASTDAALEEAPEAEQNVNTFALPIAVSSHAGLTSDAMIIDRSADGAPRIVIARA